MSEGRRLTRRAALSGAAAAGAGMLLRPGLPLARAAGRAAPAGGVLGLPVGRLEPDIVRSVTSDRPVCLAAVRWAAPAHAHIQLRARRADGGWGPWGVASCTGHDGDGVRGDGQAGEGIWTGPVRELQLRSDRAVRGVALQLVAVAAVAGPGAGSGAGAGSDGADLSGGPPPDLAADALPLAGPTLPAGPGQPPIIARRAWAGSDHPPTAGPYYGSIELGIVHHTENANGYAPGEVPAMLRAIYEFHVHGRGWFDIGYNFVIDRFGRIWEARQGGIDLPVSGAQAGDWNQISFGVSLLGTYDSVLPTPAALAALQRLLAWKLALSGLPALGEVSAVATADGIQWTQFHVGEHVRFPRIAGHRQVDSTDCPGDDLDGHLPAIRRRAAALAGPRVTLAVQGALTAGADSREPLLSLSGRLTHRGAALAGAPISVQAIVGHAGDTRTLTTVTTAADGTFTASVPTRGGMLVRALHAASPAIASELLSVTASPTGEVAEVVRAKGR